jgi:hypothetical protein
VARIVARIIIGVLMVFFGVIFAKDRKDGGFIGDIIVLLGLSLLIVALSAIP